MRIDLHTHSTISDGTLTPAELVRLAAEERIDVLAITDHDTAGGWAAAEAAAQEVDIRLVRGVEISTRHAGQGVHLLAYLVDPTYPPLVEALARILAGRNSRVPAILERLRSLGVDIDARDVHRVAPDTAATGRPHIADALVALGVVASRDEAFARYLSPGRPAYVERYAAPLTELIELVVAAGGVAVLAHPWGRHDPSALDLAGLADLAAHGLAGIEIDHQDHPAPVRAQLRGIAAELGLIGTGSSDFHGRGKVRHELACNTTAPESFEHLLEIAERTARASGRLTPGVAS